MEQFARTELLYGAENMQKLSHSRVAIFGIGGVGGYVVEALARTGVGSFVLVDSDTVSLTNLNRQIIATYDTIGKYKTQVMKERILSINPKAQVEVRNCFYLPENAHEFDFRTYSYVVDAVDTVTAKIEIIMRARECGVPVISCMGAGNKVNPGAFEVTDLYRTTMCPLAKVMRRELKKRGVEKLKVVYSPEKPIKPETGRLSGQENEEKMMQGDESIIKKRSVPGSVVFAPAVAGMLLAGQVVSDLISEL